MANHEGSGETGKAFMPYIAPETLMPELTIKSLVAGAFFGILFGAATVFLALKAGLTVSASIPNRGGRSRTW